MSNLDLPDVITRYLNAHRDNDTLDHARPRDARRTDAGVATTR